ncbi:L,D-transpeptidase [Rhizobium sp. C4]|uniref:L,D-transpeptidase n=1 Tax=Rhizobium sp. C4 TaxID=1349800 RepID=UPI001E5F29E4|nr:L,D-transpeptidase [Rhizobium sp. C4]MCD2173326.1 L,D-transpeptidase [Rhizobium sp. C4]
MKTYILAGIALAASFAASATASQASSLVAQIDLSNQTMTISENGSVRYQWKVSTARRGYSTPVGSYSAKSLDIDHRSRKYHNAPMPYSVFFKGGYAVHGTTEVRNLGRPASHGCVRLHPQNAATFFSLVKNAGLSNTRIVISQ